ncbi:arylsulfatase [Agromyces luteolus]|uniref:Sulfatase-like hydrolase/transferase n=1 Tax=Agromyces luteolus TaxID=88373 RepID=A0A7C9LX95_9MICO|nr:arylsulfatase [Agromyces luteolus]MUN07999.1 sulfatase-like hydrolase/transferase [Agromyces luteolus]GLK27988.1 arylsulfatase [Agromyces luteolus]
MSEEAQLHEYRPGTTFPGVIGRTFDESSPAWPEPLRAADGAPNVLFIVIDDMGYGQLGCYGSPIRTPNIDRIAAGGVRFANMHTTALCSPTRTCILTGRNHHSNHMAAITETSTGFPGYDGNVPFENGFLAEILKGEGYNTFAVGKWHLTPTDQTTAAGPYDRWPLGRGFERYYGFLGGDTHQYYPELVHDNHRVEPPKTPEEGYHLTEDLVDRAITFIADAKQVAPNKPFFTYFATGAMHAPHHAPKEWTDRYAGAFDEGWDVYRERAFARQKELGLVPADAELSRHDPDVQQWDSLSDDERRLYARMMEVFAGFLEHTDHQIGRLLAFLEELGVLDDTLIMLISDNGASAEGGPTGSINENKFFNFVPDSLEQNLAAIDDLGGPKYFNHYPWGWTWAGNTPFRRWKRETYRGGISDPFMVQWTNRIPARGEIRTQYAHAIDMVPTVLDLLGIEPPDAIRGVTQSPIEGVSFKDALVEASAPSLHTTQYFEMIGHRSIYHDGWRAVCPWPGTSFAESGRAFGDPITADVLRELDADGWELYHVAEDFAENHDLAAQYPDKLVELISLWYVEAGKYNVLPVDGRGQQRFAEQRPVIAKDRSRYVYFPHTSEVAGSAAPRLVNRPHTINALVEIPEGGAEGVLVSQGGVDGGYSLYVQDGRLVYTYNYVAAEYFHVRSDTDVPAGTHILSMEFAPTGEPSIREGKGTPATVTLFVDGEPIGSGDLPVTIPIMLGLASGVAVGLDAGAPLTDAYTAPFEFTGTIRRVVFDVSGEHIVDHEAELRAALARQ